MYRRSVLRSVAVTGAAAIGGCLNTGSQTSGEPSPTAILSMYPKNDYQLAVYTLGRGDDGTSSRSEVLSSAVENGSATIEAKAPPIQDGDELVYNRTVYRVSMSVEDSQSITVYPIKLDDLSYESVNVGPDAKRIDYANLPAVDREKFRDHGLEDGETMGIGTNFEYTNAERVESVLVPEPEYSVIVWGPDRKGVFSIRQQAHDTELLTYRYTVETVRESATAYGRDLREQYGFALADLPPAQADIVTAAADGVGLYEVPHGETPSEAFNSLAERFRDKPELPSQEDDRSVSDTPVSGNYIVRYDGQVYLTRLHFLDGEK